MAMVAVFVVFALIDVPVQHWLFMRNQRMSTQENYPELIDEIAAIGEPVTVIANCSTIEDLRVELVKSYEPKDYWDE